MKNNLKFSVIMPFYNSEDYIERAILSVLNQTYSNFEFILINDGSFDKSISIVEKYSTADKRIRVFNKKNGGYATAINYGLKVISDDSDYFLFLGSDDELDAELFSNISKRMPDILVDIIGFRTVKIDGKSRCIDKYSFFENNTFEYNTSIWDFYNNHPDLPKLFINRDTSRIYKTSVLRENLLHYFGKYGIESDAIFSILFCCYSSSFSCLRIDGYYWHCRPDSVSGSDLSDEKKLDIFNSWILFFDAIDKSNINIDRKYLKTYVWRLIKYYSWALTYNRMRFKKNKYNIYFSKKMIKKYIKISNIRLDKITVLKVYFPKIYLFINFFKRNRGVRK